MNDNIILIPHNAARYDTAMLSNWKTISFVAAPPLAKDASIYQPGGIHAYIPLPLYTNMEPFWPNSQIAIRHNHALRATVCLITNAIFREHGQHERKGGCGIAIELLHGEENLDNISEGDEIALSKSFLNKDYFD